MKDVAFARLAFYLAATSIVGVAIGLIGLPPRRFQPASAACLDQVAIVASETPHSCPDARQLMQVLPMPGAVMHLQVLCTCERPAPKPAPDGGAP